MSENDAPQQDLSEILRIRRQKLSELKANGQDPFTITSYPKDTFIG